MTDDQARIIAWDQALKAYGSSYVFKRRVDSFRPRQRTLTFFGLAPAITLGSVVGISEAWAQIIPYLIPIMGTVTGIQLIFTLVSLIAKWDDECAKAEERCKVNSELFREWKTLLDIWPENFEHDSKFREKFDEVWRSDSAAQDVDNPLVTDVERRIGMRAGLLQFQRPCIKCELVPESMQPPLAPPDKVCKTCGNFKL
jgi:mobilome CxxCx(11)CxxC protein